MNQAIGGLWRHKTGDGKVYLSGEVTVDGKRYRIAVFKNDFKKEGENTPDYRVYPSKVKDGDGEL